MPAFAGMTRLGSILLRDSRVGGVPLFLSGGGMEKRDARLGHGEILEE
jgi:hypothetical protein